MAYTGNSIVDYLKSEGRDSSYSARKKLAAQYGISNYSGTAAQNTQLLKKLRSGAGTSSSARSNTKSTTPVQTKSYATAYTPSATVSQKKQAWEAAENAVKNYGSYQSKYQSKLDELYDQIVNKKDFQYDLNADALYNQYKDQYSVLGKTAMMDTMGQAAALTGGYGNSYASTAGNQAYQAYLQQLNEQVPQLYQLALDKYNADRQDLYNQAGLTQDLENAAYGKWVDEYGRLADERNYAQGVYGDERDFDYGSFTDERDYQTALDQWQQEMEYQKQRDAIADKQWQEEMNFQKQQAARAASSSKSSSSKSSSSIPSYILERAAALEGDNDALGKMLDAQVAAGAITKEQAMSLYATYVVEKQSSSSTQKSGNNKLYPRTEAIGNIMGKVSR